jgi:hypothetical protein
VIDVSTGRNACARLSGRTAGDGVLAVLEESDITGASIASLAILLAALKRFKCLANQAQQGSAFDAGVMALAKLGQTVFTDGVNDLQSLAEQAWCDGC